MKALSCSLTFGLLLFLPLSAYCFYNPNRGMWISRDPVEERGGLNLYAFVQNSPVDFFDCFGLYHAKQHRELTTAALNAVSANSGTTGGNPGRCGEQRVKSPKLVTLLQI